MKLLNVVLVSVLACAVGCSDSPVADNETPATPEASGSYLVDAEPADALPVGEARQTVKDKEPIVLVGIIGGSRDPFVEGLAAFTIVDPKIPYCAPDEGCPTPWDYCCTQDQVEGNIATVKLVDESGKPVQGDARELLKVSELSTVVVQGTASRDLEGNLSVAASNVFVRPAS